MIREKLKQLARWLYKRYVNEIYIPRDTKVYIDRRPMLHKQDWGQIDFVKLSHNWKEKYIFSNFHEITESDNGIKYKAEDVKDWKEVLAGRPPEFIYTLELKPRK